MSQYRRLWTYVKPYRGRLVGGVVFSILYGPINVGVLSVVRHLWARIFGQSAGNLTLWQAFAVAMLLPVAMIARGACDFLGTYLLNWVGLRAVMDMRERLFEHLQGLSLDFYSGTQTGELISRVTNDVGAVQQAISNVVEDIVKQPVTLVCVLGWLLYADWRLTLATLVLFPICLVPIMVYGRKTRVASRKTQEHQATLVSVLHEAIAGFRVVKAFGMEERESQDFRNLTSRVFRERMKVIRSRAISGPIIEMVVGHRRRTGIYLCLRFPNAIKRTRQLCAWLVHALRSCQKNQPREPPNPGKHERGGTRLSNTGHPTHGR